MSARNGSAEWRGDLQNGTGTVTVGDGVFEGAYTFKSRFEEGEGTNPEQLIAAAHAACFSMALSAALSEAGHPPERLDVTSTVTLDLVDGAPTVTTSKLTVRGRVPGIDQAEFERVANEAKAACPVSRALAGIPEMNLTATLAGG